MEVMMARQTKREQRKNTCKTKLKSNVRTKAKLKC